MMRLFVTAHRCDHSIETITQPAQLLAFSPLPEPFRLEKLAVASLYEEGQDTTGLFVFKPWREVELQAITIEIADVHEVLHSQDRATICKAVRDGFEMLVGWLDDDKQTVCKVPISADMVVEALRFGGSSK